MKNHYFHEVPSGSDHEKNGFQSLKLELHFRTLSLSNKYGCNSTGQVEACMTTSLTLTSSVI